jgi:hypothetical protein
MSVLAMRARLLAAANAFRQFIFVHVRPGWNEAYVSVFKCNKMRHTVRVADYIKP